MRPVIGTAGERQGAARRLVVILTVLALLSSLLGVMATSRAAEAAEVTATVTMQLISVSIPDGYPTAVGYGVMELGAEAAPVSYTPSTYNYLKVQNDGNVAEDLLIQGANATCGAGTWVLASTPGVDRYSHLFGLGQTPSSYSAISTPASTLATDVPVAATVNFNLKMQTPTSTTVYGEYSTTVSVVAIAAT